MKRTHAPALALALSAAALSAPAPSRPQRPTDSPARARLTRTQDSPRQTPTRKQTPSAAHTATRNQTPMRRRTPSQTPALHRLAVPSRPVHTYSIVARDPETGQLGVAVQSHWFSVGQIVPWAEAGVGAVATQSFVDPSYGKLGLDLMRAGRSAPDAL